MSPRCVKRVAPVWVVLGVLVLWHVAAPPASAQTATAATFGNVIPLQGGTPSDVVLDELRNRLYLINNNTSLVYIFDYTANQVVSTIQVGKTPLAGAMSMDGHFLYVTCSGNSSLNVIDLTQNQPQVVQSVVLPSTPQGVEVGNDGRALVSMIGSVVAGVPQGTLAIFDRNLAAGQQLLPVAVPALPATPTPLPPTPLPKPQTTFTGKLLRTPDGQFIVGVITPSSSTTYIFVYEVASGVVLRNRTVSGQSSVLSMAPDGSRFMAGFTMFDTATLAAIAQENNANAPFLFTGAFNTLQNVGGSIFSPDGSTLYAAFNTAATGTPAPPPLASTLLVNDPTNLGIRLGINLPESIVAKMVMKADGSEAWGLSDSGLLHLPLGNLYNYPILAPATTAVFLAMDNCNLGVASGTLRINNLGKGKLTFTVSTATGGALVYSQSSGLAPASITFTMEPGRSGVVRQPGTNLWTGAGTSQGTPFDITLSSPEAINIPNRIRVYMNYRQSDQRGVIFPVPTTPNSSPSGTTNASGNEGLQDILLDEQRGRLYITNSGYNRIEVFDLLKQHFVNPIPVGQMPHQMAMGTDGTTLFVANTGSESISMVDLNLGQVVDQVVYPPVPRDSTTRNPIFPRSIAVGLVAPQFIMSNGAMWQVVGNTAIPRPASTVVPTTLTGCPACGMIATPANDYIVTMDGSGGAYVYDATADTYITQRTLFTGTIQGYYGVLGAGPGGSYFLANGLVVNPSLTTLGGSATPAAAGQRNVAAVAPVSATSFLQLTTPVRANITTVTRDDPRTTLVSVDLTTGNQTLLGVVPENPVVNVFGTTRFNTSPRQLVVNSAGTTAYAITLSGLSVISLAASGPGTRPQIATGGRGIINSSDGSTNITPGSFITVSGSSLATAATADTIPPPTVLGGSCVTFGDIAVPLLATASGQIQAQVPDTLSAGTQIVQVRSLATAQESDPVAIAVKSSGGQSTNPPAPRQVPHLPGR